MLLFEHNYLLVSRVRVFVYVIYVLIYFEFLQRDVQRLSHNPRLSSHEEVFCSLRFEKTIVKFYLVLDALSSSLPRLSTM